MLDVTKAVTLARDYARALYAEDGIANFGLEEVEYNPDHDEWYITIGFSRPWSSPKTALTAITGDPLQKRLYRVVRINPDGEVISVKRRATDDSIINP